MSESSAQTGTYGCVGEDDHYDRNYELKDWTANGIGQWPIGRWPVFKTIIDRGDAQQFFSFSWQRVMAQSAEEKERTSKRSTGDPNAAELQQRPPRRRLWLIPSRPMVCHWLNNEMIPVHRNGSDRQGWTVDAHSFQWTGQFTEKRIVPQRPAVAHQFHQSEWHRDQTQKQIRQR